MTTVTTRRPWVASKRDRVRDALIFLAIVALTAVIVLFTGFSGKLGSLIVFVFLYAIASSALGFKLYGKRALSDALAKTLIATGAFITLVPIASIVGTVIAKGYKGITSI